MTKKAVDVRGRLQAAALELFRKRGFDRTTAAEIAVRAGVTERTFFRYFPDKREVLFDGEVMIRKVLTASIADAPAGLAPLDVLLRAFRSLQPMHEEKQSYLQVRREVISTTPALHERELAKMAALADALAAALSERGVANVRAVLASKIGVAAFVQATLAWLDDPKVKLGERFDLAFHELKTLIGRRSPTE